MTDNHNELFAKIRINFLFNHPFLSVLALSIPTIFRENENAPFQTDGTQISIDLDKLPNYSEENITYLYAHTLLHIVLKHPMRIKTRDQYIWNAASNLVVNNILEDFSNIGIRPNDELIDMDLKDKCVEEVYDILYKEEEKEENDDGGEEQEDEDQKAKVTPDEKGDLKAYIHDKSKQDLEEVPNEKTDQGDMEKLDGIIIQALCIAKKNTTAYSGMAIEIDTLIKPEIDLHDTLKEYLISSMFEKQTTYERPDRRFIHNGLYLPGTKKSDELIEVYIALDSSSSVTIDEYKKFLGVVKELCEGFYEYKITILPFDKFVKTEHILSFDSFNVLNDDALFIPKSDGGTNFDEVLRYLKTTEIRSDNLLMVLTDGEFEITESILCRTLFVISEKKNFNKFLEYGKVLEFNI